MPVAQLAGGEQQADQLAPLGADEAARYACVERSVRLKLGVVDSDPFERGERRTLNLGHTLGHALETAGGHELRHGEAVAIGLVFAAELAERLGRIGPERVAEHRSVVAAYDLPLAPPPGADPDELLALMGRDKKALAGDGLTFALDGPAGVEVVAGVPVDTVRDALKGFLP